MFTIKKILVPTDFSDHSINAYNAAHQLSRRFGATVDVIHIIQTLHYFNKSIAKLSVPLEMNEDMYPQLKKQASHKLKRLMNDYLKPENKGKDIVQIAPGPARAIAKRAEEGGYDLILMATFGAHASNFLIGSIAEKVIRYSKIPVLTTGESNLDSVENILLPTDGSQISLRALPMAISLADTLNATISLFHVQELYGTAAEVIHMDPAHSVEENIRDIIYTGIREFLTHSWDAIELQRGEHFESQFIYFEEGIKKTIDVTLVVDRGISAHQVIEKYAAENADMVVMASHGRSGLAHVFLGSTTENVARHVTLPVITVKPDFDEMPVG
ncbi:universal stress protein [Fodinibius salsisoli]|uniref:Universal stress protein n=1 Tax=Fodinibius salsisoli TaxID=2820877 RepID=A0ABT3PN10_9BACT|nr:universal stress protein [Fodinibius salsisoli]MCW9707294.1 universal stress protein [Fodinibius salsisoli]